MYAIRSYYERKQVTKTLKVRPVDPQQLAAPRLTVATQPDAIHRQPEYRFNHTMLCTHRGHMRMMVLYSQGVLPQPFGDLQSP